MAEATYDIRDPIHGQITYSDLEKKVIDHPYVQRLRHIRQLGFVSMVFPGGTHDRFSHSLGVMHLAGRLFDQIENQSSEFRRVFSQSQRGYLRTCLRFAGLLHDVGHPPFSHASECHLPPLSVLKLPPTWFSKSLKERQSRHEDFTLWLLNALSEERVGVSKSMAQDIASLIHGGVLPASKGKNFRCRSGWSAHSLLKGMISGECDADRMDYLLRDSYACGVAYGTFDKDRLIQSLKPYFNSSSKQVHLCLDANGVFSFEDFLLARYHMFIQVYLHKTVLCFDYFLKRAYQEKEIPFPKITRPERFMDLTDNDIWVWLRDASMSAGNSWSRSLYQRRPAKRILYISPFDWDQRNFLQTLNKVTKLLDKKGISHFVVETSPYLTMLGSQNSPPLFVDRPTLSGKDRTIPVEKFSRLIHRYNERVEAAHVYIHHRDTERARKSLAPVLN